MSPKDWAVTPHRTIRVADDIWAAARKRAEEEGTNMTAVVVAYLIAYGQDKPTTERAPQRSPGREDVKEE